MKGILSTCESRLSTGTLVVSARVFRTSRLVAPVVALILSMTGCTSQSTSDGDAIPPLPASVNRSTPASPETVVTPTATVTSVPNAVVPTSTANPKKTTPSGPTSSSALLGCCNALANAPAQGPAAQLYLQNASQYCQGMLKSATVPGQRDAAFASIRSMLRDVPIPDACR